MVAALKHWSVPRHNGNDWIQIISSGDAETIWSRLFSIVSRHSAIKSLSTSKNLSGESQQEMCCDLTQDLYLKLQEKNRWQWYLEDGYTHEKVEHELYDIEIPNLVSRLLRKRHPESYRIARRISNILMTRKEFRCYSRLRNTTSTTYCKTWKAPTTKMVFQVYGLSDWPPNMAVKQQQDLSEMIKEIPFRLRDTRRAGRGSSSQIVISNNDLTHLLVEIFRTINCPTDIRTMRSLAQSKLVIDDSQIVSMDEPLETSTAEPESFVINIADNKPTPEEVVLEKEVIEQMQGLADRILLDCLNQVRNKPNRFRKLIEVVWHCYFAPAAPSQAQVAKQLAMSDSLVSHYRKIFDRVVRSKPVEASAYLHLNTALEKRLSKLLEKFQASDSRQSVE
jgi:hypothetical protein